MGRRYSVIFSAVAVTAAQDLFEGTGADDKPIAIVGWDLAQTSDSGDAQDEQLQLSIIRGNATSGSGGSAPTPVPLNPSDAAAAFTAEVNNTTVATTGTPVTPYTSGWNVRAGTGPVYIPPELWIWSVQGSLLCLRQTAPADSLTMSGTIFVEEQ